VAPSASLDRLSLTQGSSSKFSLLMALRLSWSHHDNGRSHFASHWQGPLMPPVTACRAPKPGACPSVWTDGPRGP
jgi:hypothetical protein